MDVRFLLFIVAMATATLAAPSQPTLIGIKDSADLFSSCNACISNSNEKSVFVKRLWFPLAPAEYSCLRLNSISMYNIIINVYCNTSDCEAVTDSSFPRVIIEPDSITCNYSQDVVSTLNTSTSRYFINSGTSTTLESTEKYQTFRLCTEIGEWIVLVFVLVVFLSKSRPHLQTIVGRIARTLSFVRVARADIN